MRTINLSNGAQDKTRKLSELMHISERIGTVRPNDAFCQALKDLADKVIQKATGHEAN